MAPREIKLLVELLSDGQKADGTAYLGPTESEGKERLWRSDPNDGLRPLKEIREISVHMNRENIAVIQVRMGSSRFAGKTMANIAGKTSTLAYRIQT